MKNPYEYPDKKQVNCTSCGNEQWVWFSGTIYICLKCIRKWMNNPSCRYDFRSGK